MAKPFAPRPAGKGGYGMPPMQSMQPMFHPNFQTYPRDQQGSNRPGPLRVYESQVIDLRDGPEDHEGRYIPLHMDNADNFEVITLATACPAHSRLPLR